jgi:hypothetical protein
MVSIHLKKKMLRISETVVLNCKKVMSKRIIFRLEESFDPTDEHRIFFQDMPSISIQERHISESGPLIVTVKKPKKILQVTS